MDLKQKSLSWLQPGMTAIVEVRASLQDVLRVPIQAVVRDGAKSFCYIRTPQGILKREVVPGFENDELVEVTDGIQEGAQVITNPRDVAVRLSLRQ